MSNSSLYEILKQREEQNRREFTEQPNVATTGSSLWDFYGQAKWGAAEQATFGLLGARDAYIEGQYGDDVDTWEDKLAGDASGDWDELSNAGKAGYMVGSAAGMIPSFFTGGLLTRGAVSQAARVGGWGAKAVSKKSTQELMEVAAKIPTKVADKEVKELLTQKTSKNIIDDTYELASDAAAMNKVEVALGSEIIAQTMKQGVRSNLKKTLNIADDEILETLSEETVKIVSRNNVANSERLFGIVAQNMGLGPNTGLIAGAMAYDAAIGVALATQRTAANAMWQKVYGVEKDDLDGYNYVKDRDMAYDLDYGKLGTHWGREALYEGMFMSLMGPVKFWKGGTDGQNLSRLRRIITQNAKSYQKPLKKYTNEELRAQLTAMDKLADGYLDASLSKKWRSKGDNWWKDATDDAGTKEMQEYLGAIRRKYLTSAPVEWVKEFGTDVFKSLPRMGVGVVAMNTMGIMQSFKNNGLSAESLRHAFGESGEEIAANIMTAMYFTKKPHSFHTESTSSKFNKYIQTGDVPKWSGELNGKANKLRKIMGGLETFGLDKDRLKSISYIYGADKSKDDLNKSVSNSIKKQMDTSAEFSELETIFKPYVGNENIGGVDLDTAFNKHITDLIEAGTLTFDNAGIWYDKLHIAKKLIDEYNSNSTSNIDISTYTPEQAFEIVREVSSIKFNGKELTTLNIIPELKDWTKKQIIKSIQQPQKMMENYIIDTYEALNIVIDKDDLIVPDLRNVIDFPDYNSEKTYATVLQRGQDNNWLTIGNRLPSEFRNISAEQQGKVKEIWQSYAERFMDHTYGENWRDNRPLDEMIMRNDAWHLTYETALKIDQRNRAFELFTGGNEHGLPSGDAKDTLLALQNLLLNRKKPTIQKPDTQPENFGEVSRFIDEMHSIMVDLNPSVYKNDDRIITFNEAEALMTRINEQVGDVITNKKVLKEFKNEILDRSIDKLGLNDKNAGLDVKASLLTLIKQSGMNYKSEGTKAIFPSINKVQSKLQSMKLDPDTYKSLLDHYTLVINTAERAKYPMSIDDTVLENKENDWYNALLKSKATGEAALDELSFDRAGQYVSFLSNEVNKFNKRIEFLQSRMNNVNDEGRIDTGKEFQKLVDERKVTENLTDLIKDAQRTRNPYILRAVGRKEGDIKNVIDLLSQNPTNSSRIDYMTEVLRIFNDIKTKAQQTTINESHIADFIKNELKTKDIQDKDVQDKSLKITTPIFSSKYKISSYEIDKLFDIDRSSRKSSDELKSFAKTVLGDAFDNQGLIGASSLQLEVRQIVDTINRLSGDVVLTPDNYNTYIVNPLKLQMKISTEQLDPAARPSSAEMDSDLYGITSNYFSKSVVKTLKVDLSGNRLIQGERVVGNIKDRGLTGLLEALDPTQKNIYLAESSGINTDGKVIRDINTSDLARINGALKSGNWSIDHGKAESEFYKTDDTSKMLDVNQESGLGGERYEIIPINESTSLFVRTDEGPGSIHRELVTQFSDNGNLFKILEAVYDGDLSLNTPQHAAVRTLLANIRGGKGERSVVEGVKLTRMLLNMPLEIQNVLDNGIIDLNHDRIKSSFKYDKLTETKNGYVPTAENRAKTDMLYKNSESQLFKNVYSEIAPWLAADKKVKAITIRDEDTGYDRVVDGANIFNSLDRAEIALKKKLANGDFGSDKSENNSNYKMNLKLIDDAKKSITDGETFVTKDFYLAAMSMIGLHPDMVRTNANNEVIGFKAGGIKPTIAHNKVNIDRNSSDYGAIEQWFGKTALKYNPVLDQLFTDLGVNMITFSTSNKRNSYKPGVGQETTNKFAHIKPTKTEADLEMPWYDFVNENNITQRLDDVITEIPLESFSLRTISKEHDPLVGANTGVHMSDNNGIANWIGLDTKLTNYRNNLSEMYTDPYHRTALAQKVMGAMSESGDPSVINSAMNAMLARDGIVIEPWAQKRLEQNLINYYINNGSIAGGVVPDGSLDVMTADNGTLDISIRSSIGDRPTVQYFGEFVPSYYAAQKLFKKPGSELNGVHNVLIQRTKYKAENGDIRDADAFLIDIQGEKFLQVEGRYIDKEGRLRDIDNPAEPILDSTPDNKKAYMEAEKRESNAYNLKDAQQNLLINSNSTLSEVANALNPLNLSIGMLNVRQPRNMIGDVVISKMGSSKGREFIASMDENAGNVSMMNSIDAIKPQDADFDFDKSFNYVAAPGEFWRETSKVAGYVHGTQQGAEAKINSIFDPNIKTGFFGQVLPDLLGNDYSYDMLRSEVDNARGQFIKMHQTATYLANIFKGEGNNYILNFDHRGIIDANKAVLQVRLNESGKYVDLVDNIGEMAKRFIDMYKKVPSKLTVSEIRNYQDEILFGKNGIFDIGQTKKDNLGVFDKVPAYDLMQPEFQHVRSAIRNRLIDPINRYLKYNRGVETDPAGVQTRATIEDYNRAYVNLYHKTLDLSKSGNWGIDPRIDMAPGLNQAIRYFDRSQNPYDIAMRELHKTHMATSSMRQEGSVNKGYKTSHELVDYFENGFADSNLSQEAMENRIFNIALNEYVRDESRILGLVELGKRERSLKIEIEEKERFSKTTEESTQLYSLRQQLSRVQKTKADMEAVISYMFGKNDPVDPAAILPETIGHGNIDRNVFYNTQGVPLVVLSKGKIKEVIQPNSYNRGFIGKKDDIVKNGRRYEVTDGEQQQGLRILTQAFGGIPIITNNRGEVKRFTDYETRNYLERDFIELRNEITDLGSELGSKEFKSREDFADYSIRRKVALFDKLFKNIEDPFYTKALILRMLTPEVSNKVVSVRSVNGMGGKKSQFDYMYLENKLSEPVMSLLSDLASGEYKPDYQLKDFANEVLNDITIMKNVAFIASKNRDIDIELLTSRMHTEPASLEGFLTQEKFLAQDIYDRTSSSNANTRDAARVMLDYATGKLVDPVVLYKASKVMEAEGIDLANQWGRVEHVSNPDGTVRKFGAKKIFISETDAMSRKDLGERGGLKESTTNMMRNQWDCLRSN